MGESKEEFRTDLLNALNEVACAIRDRNPAPPNFEKELADAIHTAQQWEARAREAEAKARAGDAAVAALGAAKQENRELAERIAKARRLLADDDDDHADCCR